MLSFDRRAHMTTANWIVYYSGQKRWVCVGVSHDGYPGWMAEELYACMNPAHGPRLTEVIQNMPTWYLGDSLPRSTVLSGIPTEIPCEIWETSAGQAYCSIIDSYNKNPLMHWASAVARIGPKAFMPTLIREKSTAITADTAISLLCGLPAPDVEEAKAEHAPMFRVIPCRYSAELANVDYNYVVDAEKRLLHIFRAIKYNTLELSFDFAYCGKCICTTSLALPYDRFKKSIEIF